KRLIGDRTRESLRVQKVLEDAAIKPGSVASDVLGVSGRAMLEALIAGERDPAVLAGMAKGRLREKVDLLLKALEGRFADHHAQMLRHLLRHIDFLDAEISALDDEVELLMAPFAEPRDLLCTIPGVAQRTAEVIMAEIGPDMSRFPTAGHLASWAGLCPGNNESAGKHRSGRTRPGDTWLLDALTQAAWASARTRGEGYLKTRFWQLARRIGKKKAVLAIAHNILTICWHILTTNQPYNDLGAQWTQRDNDPPRRTRQLIRQLEALGHRVEVSPAA
ncbi:MAG: IS110 family transposase, partial [bacterium]